ncbi:MAG: N-6 DNA methylase [Armatimonadetes bacterium]|nr:N-6 DNA methylase [Armatimonadota bacterium]
MVHTISTKQLAAILAHFAGEIREIDSDFVAQTAAYGLFLSRLQNNDLKYCDMINNASDNELVTRTKQMLSEIELDKVFEQYLAQGKNPAIYFYEEFLRAYDAKAAKGRGVHYSPPAVVDYMLRGIGAILQEQFGETAKNAVLLDPCCGIGTFLQRRDAAALPYRRAIGMEISAPAAALAAKLCNCDIFNSDSLQETDLQLNGAPLVVLGNPPYSGHSANAGAIADLMADYKVGLDERNPKWLQDDYVKFIRMAQHRVEQAGCGIVAFITNHSYLFNPTFRAMRSSLMNSFDQVYALNLYGNSKTHQESECLDENIFPIQMGVAIAFFVKTSNSSECKVMHSGIRGTREEKLSKLAELGFHSTPWEEVNPAKPFSVFIPSNADLQREFYGFASLFDIFHEHSVGFVTSRDSFAVDRDRGALTERIAALRNPNFSADEIRARYRVSDLDIEKARKALLADPIWEEKIIEVLYRPFDTRWAYYSGLVMERPRLPFMKNLMHENLALAIGRAGQVTGSDTWDVAFITDKPTDLNLFRRGGAMLFPLHSLARVNTEFLYYIYAILFSNIYRNRYADFLKMDYPRVPLIPDNPLFRSLSELGEELANVHLMRSNLSTTAMIDDISLRIGGWEIPGKYLKDRRGEELIAEEYNHLNRIREAAARTIELQDRIDALISTNVPW